MDRWKSRQKSPRQREEVRRSSGPGAVLRPAHAVFGLHAAEAAIANLKRTIKRAYLTENAAARLGPMLEKRKVPIVSASPQDLDALLGGGAVHQGVALEVEPLAQPGLEGFLDSLSDGAGVAVAVLDQVTDPHNVGAVLRSGAAFGISALIVQDRHSPPLSGTLAKAASGAVEYVPVISVVNLSRALTQLKDAGFFCTGFDSEADIAFDGRALNAPRSAFVFGAEDKGLRRLVRESCDTICALTAPGSIKSLNISNAAAIVFYEAAKSAALRPSKKQPG